MKITFYHSRNFPMITSLLSALQFSLIYVKRLEIAGIVKDRSFTLFVQLARFSFREGISIKTGTCIDPVLWK